MCVQESALATPQLAANAQGLLEDAPRHECEPLLAFAPAEERPQVVLDGVVEMACGAAAYLRWTTTRRGLCVRRACVRSPAGVRHMATARAEAHQRAERGQLRDAQEHAVREARARQRGGPAGDDLRRRAGEGVERRDCVFAPRSRSAADHSRISRYPPARMTGTRIRPSLFESDGCARAEPVRRCSDARALTPRASID